MSFNARLCKNIFCSWNPFCARSLIVFNSLFPHLGNVSSASDRPVSSLSDATPTDSDAADCGRDGCVWNSMLIGWSIRISGDRSNPIVEGWLEPAFNSEGVSISPNKLSLSVKESKDSKCLFLFKRVLISEATWESQSCTTCPENAMPAKRSHCGIDATLKSIWPPCPITWMQDWTGHIYTLNVIYIYIYVCLSDWLQLDTHTHIQCIYYIN